MPELTVRDVMTAGVVSCAPDAGLEEVAARMRERGISALVVLKDGAAAGVISQTDLVNAAFVQPYLRYWRGMAAHHLMTSPVVAVRPDAPLVEAIEILRARKIHRLVVTEPSDSGDRPVGILSMTDIARVLGDPAVGVEPARSDVY
jgi:CBS domain-containing protein